MGVGRYLLTRLAVTIPMIWVLLTVVFLVLRVLPGDPAAVMMGGRNVPPATLAAARHRLGLDQPLLTQYARYLWRIAHGDLGQSARTGHAVLADVFGHLPATIELAAAALCVAVAIGLITGVPAAAAADRPVDHLMRLLNVGAFATFIPWIGIMLKLIFSVWLHVLPTGGQLGVLDAVTFTPITHFVAVDALLQHNLALLRDALVHLVLPAATLGFVLSGFIGRMSRAGMLDVLAQDYIRTARAKGFSAMYVLRVHALRNALIPVVTVIGLQFALLMGGAVLTETTFNWPGIGRYLLEAIRARDYVAIQGSVIVIALLITSVNLVVDLAYAWLDPRVRY